MKLEFSAGGIVYQIKDHQIYFVLIQDSFDKWTFPKGHIEAKENPEIAATREVKEELGLKELSLRHFLGKHDYWFKSNNELIHKFVYYFLMEAPSSAQMNHQVKEIRDLKLFKPQEALEKLDYKKDSKELLKKAFQFLKLP